MSKHTPWRYQAKLSGSENHRGYLVIDASGFRVADVSPRDEDGIEGKQFASLIASAPAMLEALYEQYAFLADITHNWQGRHTTAGQARLIALRDLIVQATGRDEMEVQDEASMPRAAKGEA